ncbi:dihydrofolate reductase [Cellulomonas soli]|uniref:dihydrofolate reductase n=1 Tax=Cellulomonas soli TaxID=931535 RepID=UPI003F85BE97
MGIALIWACTADGVIGKDGTLPWRLPEDLARFRRLTQGCAVVMGRATWQSLPPRMRPLPDRRNLVLTRTEGFLAAGAQVVASLEEAFALGGAHGSGTTWVVGGGAVYEQALPYADLVEQTVVDVAVDGDTWAPTLDPRRWTLTASDPTSGWHTSAGGLRYRFETWRRTA